MPSFNDYTISNYGGMVIDQRRTRPYVEALRRAVKPGSAVLDIGTGTGLFAFIAAQQGAAHIYAIEPDDAIEIARLCAANNINADRIQWIQGLSTDIDLPERVDVVIGDLHGTLPFYKRNIESLKDARTRHLKPGGMLLPHRDRMYVAPACADAEYDSVRKPWQNNEYGVDFSAARRWIANSWWKVRGDSVDATSLLGTPVNWGDIDYMTVETSSLRGSAEWTIERPTTMHGYYVWFDTELGEGLQISNTPLLPSIAYGRAFFPLEREVALEPGDMAKVRLAAVTMDDAPVYQWDTSITSATGSPKARFRQSTFNSKPVAQRARLAAEDHVPELGETGLIDLAILQGMATSQPLGDIAEAIQARFPGRFPTKHVALRWVTRVSGQYGPDPAHAPRRD
ncbi:class I SAM-dependent methyltransferase [Thermomonas sp. HDW16]|uniref:50S ribosomal protein L11 methyltransferase n=1 Tax=Thermomonas sp. HDW16 TaxID=2714945 RepID=UPI00140A0919|nr:class I SAM-dependent methyltransferase [Thermomonas sp. HDW16]QIL20528.1 class I SAM-dependent methyltransferase [Thermomonas sp. HDW16]